MTEDTDGGAGRTIGTGIRRFGGAERVSGAQEFVADLAFPGALEVALVTIECGSADILAIDASEALALPGVVAVLTAADLPQPVRRFGPAYQDRPVLADGSVTYHGEPVALVAATTAGLAHRGAALVAVDYRETPGVYTLEAALADGAPVVQRHVTGMAEEGNVLRTRRYGWGDVAAAEATADLIVDNTYTFPMVTHFPIEPLAMVAVPTGEGIEVYSAVQHPYLLQRMLASILDLDLSCVRVLAPDPGGAFGGKQNPKLEPALAMLALRLGRTCRLVCSLEETFQAMRRAGARIHVRTGFTQEGVAVFHQLDADYQLGAYVDIGERVVAKGSYLGGGPYRWPALRTVARAVLTNTVPSTAFRGFGAPQVAWATESQMDAAARALGVDSLQIRLLNLVSAGEEMVRGEVPADGDWRQSVEKAAAAIGWTEPRPPGRGRGIAVAIKPGATTGLSQSIVRLLFDGSVLVYAGTSDMGQGARTIWAQIAADELGVPVERVTVVSGDTAVVPFDLQTSASRSTVFMGNAVLDACRDIRRQVAQMYADEVGAPGGPLDVDGPGVVRVADEELSVVSAAQRALGPLRGEFIGQGRTRKPPVPEHPLGGSPAFFEFNCTAVEVEVDVETGELTLLRHVSVSDVGRELNPLQVVSQDEGAAIMGLGHSLMEHMILDDRGRLVNLGALDYRIPTFADVADTLVTDVVENGDGPGPYGSKGISEGALLCTAPAIGSAVYDATGAVITDLPLTAERIWTALHTQQ
ncbi:xanthine dehydrogenase family protein molybdopterin-binding subunit [Isoptericola sp. b490]|uniref:xanthine dehydrogenase family protein molybdopterin-binding subunit n=1 Tax=Actinotalea lenta TaxID=3064654 RepID=UPI002712B3FF|nr:xanthine dehydrogenase family protein molybdopterin-binding subunit [Isoptericola sp. b490]MDO8119771.1 xanthine dehydrogenase family protein molybdopterin-binding subunit [Isoptericola sp. b490]